MPCAGSHSPAGVPGSPAPRPSFGHSNGPPDHSIALRPARTLGHLARNACALAAVDLGLLDPVVKRVRRATNLCGNRRDRLPTRAMLALVVENHPHGAFTHFAGKLVRGLAHDAPSYSRVGASGKPGAVQSISSIIRGRLTNFILASTDFLYPDHYPFGLRDLGAQRFARRASSVVMESRSGRFGSSGSP